MDSVLQAWSWPEAVHTVPLEGGLINQSWWVRGDGGTHAVLQRLNTGIFVPQVHEDIEAVTARLEERGLQTPRLVRTRAGDLWHTTEDAAVYRVLTPIGDRTAHKVHDPADARSAGHLVARFHTAVRDLDWTFRSVRPGAHDTAGHMLRLWQAIGAHPEHRLHADVVRLAETLRDAWDAWDGPAVLPQRVIHGDLKISNVRFEGPTAVALIDLDTLALGTLDIELGDALRSWCNPLSEDVLDAHFELGIFEAAMEGYAAGAGEHGPSEAEWASIVPGVERISLELAARFAADALNESYFGWDDRFGGRGEHNLLRARGQASLAVSVRAQGDLALASLARARNPA